MKISLLAQGRAGAKAWEVEATSSGVTIRYGSIGKKLRTQTIPLSACENGNAMDEALKRAEAKRNEGYEDVDTGQPASTPAQPQQTGPARLDSIKVNNWF